MPRTNTGVYSVVFSNVVPGNTNISQTVPLSINQTPVSQLLEFINEYLLDIDCMNITNSLNNTINQYTNDLVAVISYILAQLNNSQEIDFGYKAQLSRLLDLVNYILQLVPYMKVNNICNNDISANIIAWLLEDSLLLVNITEIMDGISAVNMCCLNKNNALINRYMGRLINMITKLECTLKELNEIINYVMYINTNTNINRSYVAAYVPNTCIGGARY